MGGALAGLAGAVLCRPGAQAQGVVFGCGWAAQGVAVREIQAHDVRQLRVAGDGGRFLAADGGSQLALDALGITRSCTRRKDSVNAFAGDHDADVAPPLFVDPA